ALEVLHLAIEAPRQRLHLHSLQRNGIAAGTDHAEPEPDRLRDLGEQRQKRLHVTPGAVGTDPPENREATFFVAWARTEYVGVDHRRQYDRVRAGGADVLGD